MLKTPWISSALAALALVAGCPSDPEPTDAGADSGTPTADGGSSNDAGGNDAGGGAADAGGSDAGGGNDAGGGMDDAGGGMGDAGDVGDAGDGMGDAGDGMGDAGGGMGDAGGGMGDADGGMGDAGTAGGDAGSLTDGGTSGEASAAIQAILDLFNTDAGTPDVVDLALEDVYVTYVRTIGYTVQASRQGPALFVFTGTEPSVSVGNQVSLAVTSLGEFRGMPQIDASTVEANDQGLYDVGANLAKDLSEGPGTALGPDLLAELVQVNSATVVSGSGRDWVIRYGADDVESNLYVFEQPATALCAGATLDVVSAYVSIEEDIYDVRTYYAANFANVDDSGCASLDDSNWNFEDWTTTDPPPGFIKATNEFTVTQEQTIVDPGAGEASSANLTWTSTSNQDFFAGFVTPVSPTQTATCNWRVYDNDEFGRGRVFLRWFDSAGNEGANSFPGQGYSTDGADWETLTHTAEAPQDVAGFRCGLRLYDTGGFTPGTATIYVDNLTVTVN